MALITLKQLEAFYWIVQLRTFDRAAARLNTTQSAISKRIQELEAAAGVAVFDRRQRGVRLTLQGERLLMIAEEMLELGRRAAALSQSPGFPARSLNVGVTELTALTWLPRLVTEFRHRHGPAEIRPEVGKSRNLIDRLQEGTIDLIIVPEVLVPSDIVAVPLQEVANAWLAKPELMRHSGVLSVTTLADYPILMQERSSVYSMTLTRWLKGQGVVLPNVMTCNSLVALIGMTVAGLGISYLPRRCFQDLVDAGKLIELDTEPGPPRIPYVAMYRDESASSFTASVTELAREACDFSRPFQN
ncbi:LysR family transcriptional regulator [Ancylobacter terrae]|uniref:LysR family transcriptional regulator n=1 Tax=Ancylobacter sp. sgz301288 TaxID=3342077 RepID=UPI00385CD9B2